MRSRGIFWAASICIPFWLFVIWLIKAGVISFQTLIFTGFILSAVLFFLILTPSRISKPDEQNRETIPDQNSATLIK
jgi:multisubunit Na+/H+ antiporter MnhE subunit